MQCLLRINDSIVFVLSDTKQAYDITTLKVYSAVFSSGRRRFTPALVCGKKFLFFLLASFHNRLSKDIRESSMMLQFFQVVLRTCESLMHHRKRIMY